MRGPSSSRGGELTKTAAILDPDKNWTTYFRKSITPKHLKRFLDSTFKFIMLFKDMISNNRVVKVVRVRKQNKQNFDGKDVFPDTSKQKSTKFNCL